MNKVTVIFVLALFIILGGLFAAAGAFITKDHFDFMRAARTADGTVVGFVEDRQDSGTYYPVVEFAASDGTMVRVRYNVSTTPPSYATGETVRVLYDPRRPGNAKIDSASAWLPGAVFFVLGLLFFGFGAGFVAWLVRVKRRAVRLRQLGRKVSADVVGVIHGWMTVNGRPSHRIVCKWMDPMLGRERIYKSELLWFDPQGQVGPKVDVFVDMADSSKYCVDVSFLKRS